MYMNAIEEWGWLSPSQWLALSIEEKALLAEIQTYVSKQRREAMKKSKG